MAEAFFLYLYSQLHVNTQQFHHVNQDYNEKMKRDEAMLSHTSQWLFFAIIKQH